jgi:7-cyano-7-deazaguanine synthase
MAIQDFFGSDFGMPKPAVILSSGGLDSTTALAVARAEGFELYAISFDYGQRHGFELEAARRVAEAMKVRRQMVMEIDLRRFGGSALTDEIEVPRSRSAEEIGGGIPVTYVPARNTIFLSLALGWAETLGATDLFIGVNALDYSGYPDCRPEFIEAFERLANLGTRAGIEGTGDIEGNGGPIRIHAPLIEMTKAQIIARGIQLGVDYSLTRSCYDPSAEGLSCSRCDACLLRLKGFAEAGVEDPIPYQ